MGDAHLTVENVEGGNDPKLRWRTTETYKVGDDVVKAFNALDPKPANRELQTWIQEHGGVLDDGNGRAGRVSTKNDGTQLVDHYKNGEFTNSEVVHPKGAKHSSTDAHAGAELFLALMTGGASLFIPHGTGDAAPPESKFGTTATQPADHAPPEKATAARTTASTHTTHTTTAPAKPKP